MYKIFKIIVIASFFLSFIFAPSSADAQGYKGGYSQEKKQGKSKDMAAKPIPKIFSSKVTSTYQVEKLDKLYDNLLASLWVYASTDFVYQKKLSAHIKPERFKTTRYSKEFTGDMKAAMDNLNQNYAKMASNIENAQKKYIEIKQGIEISDHEILEKLWNEKISEFQEKSNRYFKMQGKFLNTYKELVGFILNQGGSYYYKSAEREVYFYKFGGYKLYGQYVDKLNMTSFEQKKLLKTMQPANIR